MITAHKYLNLDISVIKISAMMIGKLKEVPSIKYEDLLNYLVSCVGDKSKDVFPYALNFLFLLGKLSYTKENDTFKLNETH